MSYYEQSSKPSISGLGGISGRSMIPAVQRSIVISGRNRFIPAVQRVEQAAAGFGDLIYTDGVVYWRVKDATETLSSIAVKVYGSVTVQKDIWNANPQGREVSSAKFGDPKWGWYKVGTLLRLPKVNGYPDPYDAAKKAGLVTAQEGETVVINGETTTVGAGGKIKAGLPTLAVVAALAVGTAAVVYVVKKRKASGSAAMSKA